MGFGRGIKYDIGSGTGSVSVGLSAPSALFSVTGSPVTGTGVLGLNLVNQSANQVFAGPGSGSAATPTFRPLVVNDIPALPYGTVSSVGMTVPSIFNLTGSPVTGSGTLALSLANQSANQVFAGPGSGSAAAPAFRALVVNDIPSGLPYASISGLTTNFVTKMGASSLVNSQVFDDGSSVLIGSTSAVPNKFLVSGGSMAFAGGTEFDNPLTAGGVLFTRSGLYGGLQMYGSLPFSLNPIANPVIINGTSALAGMSLHVNGNVRTANTLCVTSTPALSLGAGAGSGASFSIDGTNQAGEISITIGTGSTPFADLFTITFAGAWAYPTQGFMIIVGKSTTGSTLQSNHTVIGTTNTVTIRIGTVAFSPGDIIQLNYFNTGW